MGGEWARDLGQLRYAKTDPRALARVISNPRYQFDAEVHEHTHEPHHVLQALRVAAARCRAKDTFLVYFAGHGVLVEGRLYFILDNSCISDISTLFWSRWLLDVFTECLAHAQLLVVDSCHAGAANDREARAISVVQFAPELGSKLILYACDCLESAFELRQLEGGFLTYTLCRALEEAPPGRFSIADAVVTLQNEAELFNRSQSRCNVSIPLPFITGKPQSDLFFDDAGTSRHEHVVAAESSDDLTTTLTQLARGAAQD